MNDREYQRLYDLVNKELVTMEMRSNLATLCQFASEPEIERLKAELTTARTERDKAVKLLGLICDDFDQAIAAHSEPGPGGQHHNGPCCEFGNVTPGALGHMRRLKIAIDTAIAGKADPNG